MNARNRMMAIGIIAAHLLLGLGALALAWQITGRVDHPPVLVMSGLALIGALVMSALLAMMPDPRGMLFFGVFFGLVILPHFIAFALAPREVLASYQHSSPPAPAPVAAATAVPTETAAVADLTAGILDARGATLSTWADGSQVLDIRYDTPEFARLRFLAEYRNQPPPLAHLGEHDGVLVETEGYVSFQYQQADRVMRITGASRELVEQRLQALARAAAPAPPPPAVITPPPAPDLVARFGLPQMLGALFAYVLFVSWVFFRLSSWAASYPAPDGVAAVPAQTLKTRLLHLGQMDLPFTVQPGEQDDELLAEWRYADASWLDQMRTHRIRRLIRYRMRLDEASQTLRVLEYRAAFDASAGGGGAAVAWQAQRGITFFEKRTEGVLGLQLRNGRPTRDLSYVYRFDVDEIRGPLLRIVNDSGWHWRTVMLDLPWLTG
ncbi:MAG TPA: hypothetical protein VLI06_13990 [Solimonas sp.]|nr:hypothetical protein [Solimonas sp.]